ncbi:hypothetical protein MMC26_002444 [Xylographa opegraphella]|nr:hypothetical protein [Xylographa opegraphella]
MGRIRSLLSNGIGLAIEVASSNGNGKTTARVYDSSTYERSTALRRPQNNRRSPVHEERWQSSCRSANNQDYSLNDIDPQGSIDDDYGKALGPDSKDRTWDDRNVDNGEYFNRQFPSNLSAMTSGHLACPVIIPQRRPEDKSRGWVRAYAPALMDCGIDQAEFISFIDSFNEASKSSPYLDVVNIAALGVGFAPGITPIVVSIAVPVAVRFAKQAQTKQQSNSYLDKANTQLFAPRGLFALVMTFKPDQKSQIVNVDTSSPSSQAMQCDSFSPLRDRRSVQVAQNTTYGEFQLPPSAPLIFPYSRPGSSDQPRNTFVKMSEFVADYSDRRAQARYVQANPDSVLSVGPAPTFASRFGDPNYVSSKSQSKSDRRALKDQRKADKKNGRPSLIGGLKGMVPGSSAENGAPRQTLLKSLKSAGMENDVLYLMIVNKPTERESGSASDQATSVVRPNYGLQIPQQDYYSQPQDHPLNWNADESQRTRHGIIQAQSYNHVDYNYPLQNDYGEELEMPPRYTPRARRSSPVQRKEPLYCVPTL